MNIPESFRRLFIRNAILENINILDSLITEAAGFISHKEKMKNTALQLSKVKETIKQQVGQEAIERLEKRTDMDYTMWVYLHAVPIEKLPQFEEEFRTLVKKYS